MKWFSYVLHCVVCVRICAYYVFAPLMQVLVSDVCASSAVLTVRVMLSTHNIVLVH